MARPRKAVPVLHYHKSSRQYYIRFEGGKVWLGRDEAAADQRRRELVAERLVSGVVAPKPSKEELSVAEACVLCVESSAATRDRGSHGRTVRGLNALAELYGMAAVGVVDQLALQRVRTHLLGQRSNRGKGGGPLLSRNYVNKCIKDIQRWWGWLEERRLVPDGAAARLRTVRALREGEGGREIEPPTLVDDAVVERTLPFLTTTVAAMVQVQRLTGMRPGEVKRMRPGDIARTPADAVPLPGLRGRVARGLVVDGVPVWVYVPSTHKTRHRGKSRVVALGPRVQAILSPFLAVCESEQFIFRPASKSLTRFGKKGYYQAVQQGIDRANVAEIALAKQQKRVPVPIPAWFPNQLRHSAGTEARDLAGHDAAAAFLGHASPDATTIYAEAAIGKAAAIAAKIG